MTEQWLDHVDLPDGQFADLLKRYPYERATMIELERERDIVATESAVAAAGGKAKVEHVTTTSFIDVVLRASLWRARLKNDLTGEEMDASGIGMANKKIVSELSLRALANYVAWYDEAYPGPKESSTTEAPIPSGENPALGETSA